MANLSNIRFGDSTSDVMNPANYYSKTEIDAMLAGIGSKWLYTDEPSDGLGYSYVDMNPDPSTCETLGAGDPESSVIVGSVYNEYSPNNSVIIGTELALSNATNRSVLIGSGGYGNAQVWADDVAIGYQANGNATTPFTNRAGDVTIGSGATTVYDGYLDTTVKAGNSVAIGKNAKIWRDESQSSDDPAYNTSSAVALGANSVANASNTVSVGKGFGNDRFTRRITNVTDGVNASDAATVGQVPVITMQTADPGEGQPLAANHFIAVYE